MTPEEIQFEACLKVDNLTVAYYTDSKARVILDGYYRDVEWLGIGKAMKRLLGEEIVATSKSTVTKQSSKLKENRG